MTEINNAYLEDLYFSEDFEPSKNGDLLTITGKENLSQALFHRLITSKGSLVHRPDYGVGIKDFEGGISSLASQRELALRIKDNFEQEPRIKEVTGLKFNQDDVNPSQFTVIVKYEAIGYNNLEETFDPFRTIL